jgi:hypothetical protein
MTRDEWDLVEAAVTSYFIVASIRRSEPPREVIDVLEETRDELRVANGVLDPYCDRVPTLRRPERGAKTPVHESASSLGL